MSFTLKKLRDLPEAELIVLHDGSAQHTNVGVNYYLDELARRDAVRLSEAIKENTDRVAAEVGTLSALMAASGKRMEHLTIVIAVLTAVAAAAAVVAVAAA